MRTCQLIIWCSFVRLDNLCYFFDEVMADMTVDVLTGTMNYCLVHQHILNLVITRRVIQHVVTHIDKNHSMTAFMMLTVWLST